MRIAWKWARLVLAGPGVPGRGWPEQRYENEPSTTADGGSWSWSVGLGRMALENDFLSKSLQASKGSTLEEQRAWRGALYGEVMQLEGKAGLSIRKHAMPRVLAVSDFIGTSTSTCRGRRTRNCASRSNKSALITVATVLDASSWNYRS